MPRMPREEEIDLIMRLVGSQFAEIDIIREQVRTSRVDETCEGYVLEFIPLRSRKLKITRRLLGEGSSRDVDGTPVVFSLLQKDGYLWRLDISRVDGQRIRGPLNYAAVVALGFAQGLSLDDSGSTQEI